MAAAVGWQGSSVARPRTCHRHGTGWFLLCCLRASYVYQIPIGWLVCSSNRAFAVAHTQFAPLLHTLLKIGRHRVVEWFTLCNPAFVPAEHQLVYDQMGRAAVTLCMLTAKSIVWLDRSCCETLPLRLLSTSLCTAEWEKWQCFWGGGARHVLACWFGACPWVRAAS